MQNHPTLSDIDDNALLVAEELFNLPERKNKAGEVEPARRGILPVSRSTFYAGIAAGLYPKPIRLSKQKRAWRAGDIKAFIASQSQVEGV